MLYKKNAIRVAIHASGVAAVTLGFIQRYRIGHWRREVVILA